MNDFQENYEMDYTQNIDLNSNVSKSTPKKSNNSLIIVISVLACLLVVLLLFLTLFLTGIIRFGNKSNVITQGEPPIVVSDVDPGGNTKKAIPVNKTMYVKCGVSVSLLSSPSGSSTEIGEVINGSSVHVIEYPDNSYAKVNYNGQEGYLMRSNLSDVPTVTPVGKTMYVNCNTSLTLRTGPSTGHSEIYSIAVGDPVYVIEYTTSDFAKVTHNSSTGYVMSRYLSDSQPYVWQYNASEVENFVANAIRAFVNGVNSNNSSYAYNYYSGSAASDEVSACNYIASIVIREDLLSLNCHSATRISPTRVNVIRDSVIRVTYNDGSVKDITERIQYTVENSGGRMSIVAIKDM